MTRDPKFEKCAAFTLLREGPMSNDAVDPGGLTKYGFAAASHPGLDIANLTKEHALDLYFTDYYLACSCDLLPFAFSLAVFECAVNQGQGTATRLLQTAIGVTADGHFGTISKAALSVVRTNPEVLSYFLALRVQAYVKIKDSNAPLYEADNKGWFKRLFLCTMAGSQ